MERRGGVRRRGAVEHRHQHGDAEHGAHLTQAGEHGAAGGEAGGRQPGHGRAPPGGEAEAHAAAGEELAGQKLARVVGRGVHRAGEEQAPRREQQRAGHGHHALAVAVGDEAGHRGGQRGHQRRGRDRHARLEHRPAPDLGGEEDVREEQRVEGRGEGEHPRVRHRERANAEQAQLDHRGRVVRGAPDHQREQRQAGGERAQHARAAPAPVRPLHDAERDQAHAQPEQQRAERVGHPGTGLVADLAQQAARGDDGGKADRHVHEERPAPAAPVHEHAAERRPERGGHRAGGGPDRGGGGTLVRGELGEQEPERGGHEDRAAHGLEHARRHEHLDRSGHPHRTDAPRNVQIPIMNMRRRPTMSAIRPAGTSSAAKRML